ncbi:MAG: AraC family transcriptional regulator, partial [Bacteroidales bacterium]
MEPAEYIIHEITPLSDRDCFYIADRRKTEFSYPIHCHAEYELNFIESAAGVKRIVGDSSEVIGNYELVLITGKELEHVWEQHECRSKEIREITIQFSNDLFSRDFLNKNQFDSIRKMLERAQQGIAFPVQAIMKVYNYLDRLAIEEQGFYAVMNFLRILYELSQYDDARVLSSSSFAKIDTYSDSRRVQKMQKYIQDHYKEDIRLSTLSDIVGMTPVSISRFFKLRTGKTLSDYVIDIRLGFA